MEDERRSPGARRRSSIENVNSSPQAEGETETPLPENPEELEVPCTEDCPLRSEYLTAGRNPKSEKQSSPVGIRALYQLDEGKNGKKRARHSAERVAPTSIPQHSSAHYCDPDIAAIIYRHDIPSSDEGKATSCKRPHVNFPCFGKKIEDPECWLEMHKNDYLSITAEEQERLRKEKDWKKIQEGPHGKSISQQQAEWERGLRQYDYCLSWQRHIGEHIRKRHRDKLIKAAVREKPISKLQEIRSDAKMMERELFATSRSLDEYKQKTHLIVNVLRSRRQSQRDQEAFLLQNRSKIEWRKTMAKVRSKLKELLPVKKSSQLIGEQSNLGRSEEVVVATPCSCRAKEIKSFCRSSQEDSKGDALNKPSTKPMLATYQPKLKKTKSDDKAKGKSTHDCSDNVKKSQRHPSKAQILREAQLDADEWSIIDPDSPKHGNQFKCFGR